MCPLGTWSFRARLVETIPAHARAPPLAAAAAGGGAGAGPGSGAGAGSLPGPVLFEPGLTGMGYAEHARFAIRIRTAQRNGCQPTAADSWAVAAVETNRCNGPDRSVATVRLDSDPFTPPGAL